MLKKFDELHGDNPKSLFGGVITILAYLLAYVYLVYYILRVSDAEHELEIMTSVALFPNSEDSALLMPAMKCIASSGCYITKSTNMQDEKYCNFFQTGEALPDSIRGLFYDNDPLSFFTVMSMDGVENFALSYDVENVVKYTSPLQTEYIEAAEALGINYVPQPYKIYRGVSTFNLIETRALDRTVSTWLSSITTETSQFTGSGGCCGGDLYDSAGNLLYAFDDINNPVHIDACMANPDEPNEQDRWWTSKLQPPTTYVLIDVINPLDAWLIFALFGGWLGVLKLGGSYVYISVTKTCCSMKNDDVMPETVAIKLGTVNVDNDKTS